MKPNRNELIERFATFNTDRLLGMLDQREGYTDEAIEVVQAELARRKIGEGEIQEYVAALGVQHAEATKKAAIPLGFWEKVFFFFVWFVPGFISVALGINYFEDGYTTKLYQSRFFRITGFASLFLTGFLSVLTSFMDAVGILLLVALFAISYGIEKVTRRK